ncbi:MAG: hypothetical protein RJB60_1205 [Pseudomonadota bacterium]
MNTRRHFLRGASLAGLGTAAASVTSAVNAASVNRASLGSLPEPVLQTSAATMPPLVPATAAPTTRSSH